MPPAAILDIDGTLVDTNYHHALAWARALRQHDVIVPLALVHRHIGMGGDQLVAAVAGEEVEKEKGDDVRTAEKALYLAMIEEIEPLDGARELLEELCRREPPVVLASSAKADEVEHYLDLLGARDLVDGWTTSADVESTKPEPDLVRAALDRAGTREAVLVGDTTWDCEAAARAGVPAIGVLSGGFCASELGAAGAVLVVDGPRELLDRLEESPFGAATAAADR